MSERRELATRVSASPDLEALAEMIGSQPMNGYDAEPYGSRTKKLRMLWGAVRKRLWLIIALTLLVTTMVAVYMARKPDFYLAQARVQVDLEQSPAIGSGKGSSIILTGPGPDPAYFNTQLLILNSPELLRRVVRTLDLEHDRDFRDPPQLRDFSTWQSLRRMFGFGSMINAQPESVPLPLSPKVAPAAVGEDLAEAERLQAYVQAILRNFDVAPVRDKRLGISDSRLIDISYIHADPQVAARIVNSVADAFVQQNLEHKTQTNTTESEFLLKRIAELQTQIREGEERLISYTKNNDVLPIDTGSNPVVERLNTLNRQLLEAENDRKLAEAAYQAATGPGAAVAEIETSSKITEAANAKINELRQRRALLLIENTTEFPEVKEIDQQIAEIQKGTQESRTFATNTLLTTMAARLKQTQVREQALRTDYERQRSATISQNQSSINYKIIQQEIETYKSLLQDLLQRSKENEVVQAGATNNIRVVDHALRPRQPLGLNRLSAVLLALPLSLAFGIGLALLIDFLNDTIRSEEDVERVLRLPLLSVVPSFRSLMGGRRLLPAKADEHGSNGHGRKALLLNGNGKSIFAEPYRLLRTSVLLSIVGRAPKTILVTSSVPGEGKTTTGVNLAVSLAQTGASVLLIDADLRRPQLHTIFDFDNDKGLSTFLSSDAKVDELFEIIKQPKDSEISILPSGPAPPFPAELLGSDKMRLLINLLSANYSHIIIDSPPITAFTDSILLATMVDGVLLVVKGGQTPREAALRSRKLLQDVGAQVLGVVLNNIDLQEHTEYYYQGYLYDSRYYSKEAAVAETVDS